MVTRTLYAGVVALWFLANHVVSQETHTTVRTSTPTSSALISTSTFVSPALRSNGGGLSDKTKVGISVGVTLGAIIIGGSLAILCVKRRRNKALSRPETRVPPSRDVDDENMVAGSDPGKGKQAHYMSAPSTAQHGVFQQPPYGAVYQGEGYPTMPNQAYIPPQQSQAIPYPTGQYAETYVYSGTAYPGSTAVGTNQQHGYPGPINAQYQPNAAIPVQPQYQQQQGEDLTWIYPASALSPVEGAPLQDLQCNYLQDYQPPQGQASNPPQNEYQSEYQNGKTVSPHDGQYHVPPPHPDASELPEQRRPIELMGEGHYKEAP
ncbi:hypothetical protein NPX13_g237 [Xylaria arbuscula]|uniref:Uncharacterized protein n=1 Tax=Xylaria arbuscula TaxID=114810 RepID=A0A9W8NPM0_9PEZI|nr:hypothetical protein NPX13_g237 [Xylaria arbuscula]